MGQYFGDSGEAEAKQGTPKPQAGGGCGPPVMPPPTPGSVSPAALLVQAQYSRFEGITYPEPVQYSQYDQQSGESTLNWDSLRPPRSPLFFLSFFAFPGRICIGPMPLSASVLFAPSFFSCPLIFQPPPNAFTPPLLYTFY